MDEEISGAAALRAERSVWVCAGRRAKLEEEGGEKSEDQCDFWIEHRPQSLSHRPQILVAGKRLGKSGCMEVCSIGCHNLGYTVLAEVKASGNRGCTQSVCF